jgi:ABC-type enterochelin transport system permease subunit
MFINNFIPLIAIIITILLVPIIVRQAPYFKRKEVMARQLARAKLPPWILFFELFTFLIAAFLIGFLFVKFSIWLHGLVHPDSPYLSSGVISISFNSFFDLIKVFMPFPVGVLLGAILGNFISWCVPAIREMEYKTMQNVPNASFGEVTMKLIKISAIIVPIAIILMLISIFRS